MMIFLLLSLQTEGRELARKTLHAPHLCRGGNNGVNGVLLFLFFLRRKQPDKLQQKKVRVKSQTWSPPWLGKQGRGIVEKRTNSPSRPEFDWIKKSVLDVQYKIINMKLLKKAIEYTANTTEKQKNCTER